MNTESTKSGSDKSPKSWRGADVLHEGAIVESVNGFDVIECQICGFKHVIPIPTAEELEKAYKHEYYTREKPLYIERYLEDQEWWNLVYAERYDILECHLGAGRRRLLDVGSGPGLFLLNGRQRGWTVRGIEASNEAAAYSRESLGLDVINDFLNEQTAPALGRFDAVNMGEVLEHLPDPASMLRLVHGCLDDGGLICLVVPNDFNPFQIILRDNLGYEPWWVAPPHHINYFDFDSLPQFVERCGFQVIHEEATFPIDLFLMMGDNYVGNESAGRECHAKRKHFELALQMAGRSNLKRKMYEAFANLGIGREILMFARKAQMG